MLIVFSILLIYVGSILAYSPNSGSLKDTTKISLRQRIYKQKGVLSLGTLLISVHLLAMDDHANTIADNVAYTFGLSYAGVIQEGHFYQLVTSTFVHINLVHLCSNLLILALLSAYERRVVSRRFFLVFFISSLVSSVADLFCVGQNIVSMGASAGICGLVAAYFIDYAQTSWKEWSSGVFLVLVIILFYTFSVGIQQNTFNYQINWLSHLIGAITGAFFIKLVPFKDKTTNLSEKF